MSQRELAWMLCVVVGGSALGLLDVLMEGMEVSILISKLEGLERMTSKIYSWHQ